MALTINTHSPFGFFTAAAGVFLAVCMVFGCRTTSSYDLSGTYVNTAGSEFSLADDTLEVEWSSGNDFLIHRRTGFRLLDDQGRPGRRQHQTEEWTAVYDRRSGVMTERRNGKVITFNQQRTVMTVGKRRYGRIN